MKVFSCLQLCLQYLYNSAYNMQTPSGSAAKYEDKNLPTKQNTGSKADEKPEDKLQLVSKDADNVDTQLIADSKQSVNIKTVDVAVIDNKAVQDNKDVDETSNTEAPKPIIVAQSITAQVSGISPDENISLSKPNTNELIRNDHSSSEIALFTVGDFVKINNSDGTISEGLLMEVLDDQTVIVDIGSEGIIKQVLAADCELIVKSDELEVGDQVQVQPNGSAMYFVGKISQINIDGTYDIVMEGDDPDDIESNVKIEHIRKLMSRRAIVVARWKRAALVVSSINNFASFALDSNQFNPSTRASAPASLAAALRQQQGINRDSVKEVSKEEENEITPLPET